MRNMNSETVKAWTISALVAMALVAASPMARAADDPANIVKYRRTVMQTIAGHINAIAGIVKGKVSFPAHIAPHARAMHAMSNLLYDIFPEGTGVGKTRAKPEIWQEPVKFRAAIDAFRSESGRLALIAEGGDLAAIGAQLKKVGKACGGCHKPFRQKKKKQ